MKKSNVKKTAAIIVATIMCFSASNGLAAKSNPGKDSDSDIISPMNIAISFTKAELTLGLLGNLNCYGKTEVQYGYYAEVIVELQQYNGSWNTIKTWSDSKSNAILLENNWYVEKGYSYRLKTTHKAYNSNWILVETINKYSNMVSYK